MGVSKKEKIIHLSINGFSIFISKIFDCKYRAPSSHKSIFKIVYYGKILPAKIVELLYKDANISLDRKLKIAKQIMKENGV
jgi:hypothetical protein